MTTPNDLIRHILSMTPAERYEYRQRSDIADSFVSFACDLEHLEHAAIRENGLATGARLG